MRPTFGMLPGNGSPSAFMYIPYLEMATTQILEAKSDTPLSDPYDSWNPMDQFHHRRRTLDQFWYKSLDTEKRDFDQVISRYLRSQGTEGLLVVD